MTRHPLKAVIEAADRAITAEDFDRLMDFYTGNAVLVVKPGLNATGKEQIRRAFVAIAEHFKHGPTVHQGDMTVLESGDTALVVMETRLDIPSEPEPTVRRATYVFRKGTDGAWCCPIDNPYGTDLLNPPETS